jgi:hypothetical protein
MLEALESAESKLREYYAKTDDPELGNIYAHGTILAPQHKLQFFRGRDWIDQDYASLYLKSLQDRMKIYQTDHLISKPQASIQASELDRILAIETESTQDQDELTRFLQGGKLIYFSLTSSLISLISLRFSLNWPSPVLERP